TFPDVLVNADNAYDCDIHVAYGDGHGHFNSTLPLPALPSAFDHRTSVFEGLDQNIKPQVVRGDGIMVAGSFDPAHPGVLQIVGVACPPSAEFSSDVCGKIPGGCEAVIGDIDDDGLDDIIATQGQQVGLLVGRANAHEIGFHESTLETE